MSNFRVWAADKYETIPSLLVSMQFENLVWTCFSTYLLPNLDTQVGDGIEEAMRDWGITAHAKLRPILVIGKFQRGPQPLPFQLASHRPHSCNH